MNMTKDEFYNIIKSKKIAFIGLGVSHNDLIRKYCLMGGNITILDKVSKENLGDTYTEFATLGVKFVLGENYLKTLNEYDLVFRSPGVKYMLPEILAAKDSGVVITSEMEMFFQLCPCKIYAVTGSDGKTTTTTIISEMFKRQFLGTKNQVYIGGNIGVALLPLIDQIKNNDVCVVELSSFQLISMHTSPDVAVITNLSPNHLDAHKDMNEYITAKTNIINHQNAFSRAVFNMDNAITKSFFGSQRGEGLFFTRVGKTDFGTFLDDSGDICFKKCGTVTHLFNKKDIHLAGEHNVENFLAATAAVIGDVDAKTMKAVAKEFGGVEHRNEFIREVNGVKWYNDSIASSPTRTIAGLSTFEKKIILIAGGYDKHIPMEPLAPAINTKVKVLILMGDTAQKIKSAVISDKTYNSTIEIITTKTMEEAVEIAKQKANKGDCVTLSPASASFGMYKNFEYRGNHFKELVNKL